MTPFRMIDANGPQEVSVTFSKVVEPDPCPDTSYLDAEGLSDLAVGRLAYVGVMAQATIVVPAGSGSFAVYELLSPGLWGVEVRGGDTAYLDEIFQEQVDILQRDLRMIAASINK